MAIETRVANVEKAIELAETWRAEGRYNWFRGQLQAWQPTSSIERKIGNDLIKHKEHEELISRFIHWARKRPELAYLAEEENMNALYAILQHYGVPTSYIDFSTEPTVAGFFSADTPKTPTEPTESVIYCLNSSDLQDFYENEIKNIPEYDKFEIELVSVDVSNLWRLQAQHGHFIYANHQWYKLYDMDKIVFPWTGYPAYPTSEEIYPKHKSALEQSLDDFFFLERRRHGNELFKQIATSVDGANLASFVLESPADFYSRDAFKEPLSIHSSWGDTFNNGWKRTKIENFSKVTGKTCRLQVRQNTGAADLRTQIRSGMEYALRDSLIREHAVDWMFTGLPAYVNVDRFMRMVREIWNGMRNLPYTDMEICEAIAQLAQLTIMKDENSYRTAMYYTEDAIEVEFCIQDFTSARAFCSAAAIKACMSTQVVAATVAPYEDASCEQMLLICHNPQILLDFEQFKHIFATHIIPSQLAIGRPIVIYNPALLLTFGLP